MTDAHESTKAAAGESVQHTAINAGTGSSMVPMDDADEGPMADKDRSDELSEEEVAAQLGDFA